MTAHSALVTTASGRTEPSTRTRVRAVCVVLALTGIAAVPLGILWPGNTNSSSALTLADVQSYRQAWWALIMAGVVVTAISAPAQAVAVLTLVRQRGAATATAGAGLMWFGSAMEAVGLAGFAGAYFYPSDPSISDAAGTEVFASIARDHVHLLAVLIPGHLMLTAGIVTQAVALLRSRVVPVWVPILSLSILVTYVIPGSHAIGLVTQLPLAATCVALAYYAWSAAGPTNSQKRQPS